MRAAVGTSRWRIKFAVLGIAFIFTARLFTATQGLLYMGRASDLIVVESIGTLVGCVFISIGYFRRAFEGVSVFPSRALLQGSLTILLVGGYLVVSGVAAKLAVNLGAITTVRSQVLIILLAIAFLACFLFSDRSQQYIAKFVTRHFRLPIHDYRQVWTNLTRILSGASDERQVAHDVAQLLSQTFNALTVNVWVSNQARKTLVLQGSTRESMGGREVTSPQPDGNGFNTSRPFDLEGIDQPWAVPVRTSCAPQFPNSGRRLGLPLVANQSVIGLIVLGDRVNGRPYLVDEHDLLECIGEQVAAAIYRISSTAELVQSKEMEAFQSMSAFFVHDLKNAASSLNLALENLPTHFHDPEFREDALRVVRRTVQRIKELIARLSTLRTQLEISLSDVDLNVLVTQVLGEMRQEESISLSHELAPLPLVRADRDQLRSVITNLLLNARDAIKTQGHIRVETTAGSGCAVLSITDDGCGMPPDFVQQCLFRPFQSTKTSGLGIGMFQSKQIVKAHSGSIEVETAVGEGTRFEVTLPTAIHTP
jgi:putative PEP-CTERM system histidine kinase